MSNTQYDNTQTNSGNFDRIPKEDAGLVDPYEKIEVCESSADLNAAIQRIMLEVDQHIPRILPYKNFSFTKDGNERFKIHVIMPRMKTNFKDLIQKRAALQQYFSQKEILQFILEILETITALKDLGVAHGNLKLTNLFQDYQGSLQIADIMNDYRFRDRPDKRIFNDSDMVAPELRTKQHGIKLEEICLGDIYSLGIIMFQLSDLSTTVPSFDEVNMKNKLKAIAKRYSDYFGVIIAQMAHRNPAKRWSVTEAQNFILHSFSHQLQKAAENPTSRTAQNAQPQKPGELPALPIMKIPFDTGRDFSASRHNNTNKNGEDLQLSLINHLTMGADFYGADGQGQMNKDLRNSEPKRPSSRRLNSSMMRYSSDFRDSRYSHKEDQMINEEILLPLRKKNNSERFQEEFYTPKKNGDSLPYLQPDSNRDRQLMNTEKPLSSAGKASLTPIRVDSRLNKSMNQLYEEKPKYVQTIPKNFRFRNGLYKNGQNGLGYDIEPGITAKKDYRTEQEYNSFDSVDYGTSLQAHRRKYEAQGYAKPPYAFDYQPPKLKGKEEDVFSYFEPANILNQSIQASHRQNPHVPLPMTGILQNEPQADVLETHPKMKAFNPKILEGRARGHQFSFQNDKLQDTYSATKDYDTYQGSSINQSHNKKLETPSDSKQTKTHQFYDPQTQSTNLQGFDNVAATPIKQRSEPQSREKTPGTDLEPHKPNQHQDPEPRPVNQSEKDYVISHLDYNKRPPSVGKKYLLNNAMADWNAATQVLSVKWGGVDVIKWMDCIMNWKDEAERLDIKDELPAEVYEYLQYTLPYFQKLLTISFDMKHCKLTENQTNSLKGLFSKISWLKNVHINNCKVRNKAALENLTSGLGYLNKLEGLSLSLQGCSFDEKNLQNLSHALDQKTNLRKLFLNFINSDSISDLAWLKNGLNNLRNLSVVYLLFDGVHITSDSATANINQALANKPNLKIFELSISQCRMTNLAPIIQGLQNSPNIETLALNFSQNEFEFICFSELTLLFRNIASHLQNLTINLSECVNIDNDSISVLEKGMRSLTNLKKLNISLFKCQKIQDPSLESLSQIFIMHEKITDFRLVLANCHGISDNGIGKFLNSMTNCKLQRLTLHLGKCQITNTSLQSFAAAFKHLITIKDLQLNFDECKKITTEGLILLFSSLQNFKNKFEFLLSVEKNKDLGDQLLIDIADKIPSVPNLQRFVLQARMCQFSPNSISEIRKAQNKNTSVTLFVQDLQFSQLQTQQLHKPQYMYCISSLQIFDYFQLIIRKQHHRPT